MKEQLPIVNQYGYYEIRLESIGGLGANLCGKMLGELGAVYLGLNAASFSSYGSEKRGSPVKAYVRWCKEEVPIRVNSPVKNPHMLILFHEAMLKNPSTVSGITRDTKVIINTALSAKEAEHMFGLKQCSVYTVDALQISMETKSRLNMVMLGAAAKASGFIAFTDIEKLVLDTIGKKYPAMKSNNLEAVKRGYEEVSGIEKQEAARREAEDLCLDKKSFVAAEGEQIWGYQNAPIGGINPIIGNTVTNDLSASREGYIPLFIQERCINCGLCDITCPDMVFQFEDGKNCGLDYHHCKGCLRCVSICPVNALVCGVEKEHPDKQWDRRNKDVCVEHLDYEKAGANAWVTSESFSEEKRVDGGESK